MPVLTSLLIGGFDLVGTLPNAHQRERCRSDMPAHQHQCIKEAVAYFSNCHEILMQSMQQEACDVGQYWSHAVALSDYMH